MSENSGSSGSSPFEDFATHVLGPNPFPKDDPRHEQYLELGLVVRELDARRQANMLKRFNSAPDEELHKFYVQAVIERFDLAAAFAVLAVTDYQAAAECEQGLRTSSERTHDWFRSFLAPRTFRWVSKGDLLADLKMRLAERVAHFTAQALRCAREAAGSTPSAQPVAQKPPARATPSQVAPSFPIRAEWLRDRLAERKWTAQDLDRFGGPNWRTTRKILQGEPVRQVVLEKIAHGLSTKAGRVSSGQIPIG